MKPEELNSSLIKELEHITNQLRTWTIDQLHKSIPNADSSALTRLISGSIADKLQSILDKEVEKNPMISA